MVKRVTLLFVVTFTVIIIMLGETSLLRSSLAHQELNVWSFPRVDEMYFKTPWGKIKEYDAGWNIYPADKVHHVRHAGWNYSLMEFADGPIALFGINCRDIAPESSGKFTNYHNRRPGFQLYPLNVTSFRKALKILAGNASVKGNIAKNIFGTLYSGLDSFIPPTNKYWFNANLTGTQYSPSEAYKILVEAGFSNSSGYWICPNGQELRQIYVAALAESPTHAAFCEELVERWNNFFGKRSDGSDYFVLEIHADFSGWLLITFGNRDFDIVYYSGLWIGMPPSHFPLYFYYYFHVENDRSPWGWNIFGFNDSVLNDLTWKLKFGRDPNTGRLLSLYELRQVCFKAQQIIEDEVPLIPLLVRGRFTAFRPELAGWNFEFDQRWLYVLTNWENLSAGGGLNWLIDYISEKWSLHPLTLHRKYQPDTYLFDAVFDPLIVFDPYSGEEMAWAAIDWRRELWSDVALNVSNGMKVTFWLRDDMYWHDGVPISAEDVKFCWEYLKRYDAPIFKDVASKLVRVETEGDYAVHAYLNSTSYALIYDLADTALLLPKHLWENVTDPLTFKPWKHIHPLFNGSRKSWPGWWSYDWPLTLYVGSGPFIFHKWNSTAKPEYIHVVRNPHYWVTCPVVSGIAAKPYTLVGSPVNFTVALTSVLDENTTVELSIYVDDVLWDKVNVALEPFGHERFGPYTIEGLSPGIHTIKTAHTESTTGMSFNYTQKLTVTIPEDLNRDLHVDMQDIFIAANSFGAYPNHPRWSPQADINKDNYVGIDDIYLIAKKFGWTAKENQ